MMQNSFVLPIEELKDDNILKINKMYEEEFIKDITEYEFPSCQKDQSHSQHKIQFGILQKNSNEKENSFIHLEPGCQLCLQNTSGQAINLKELFIKTYHVANLQCDKNYFKDCIDETLILLQESLKRLSEVKERIEIYCEEVKEKIENLQQKAQFYPPIYVRDILTRIKDSKDMNQDERNSTIMGELKLLSQQILFDERQNLQPIIKGATLDVSLYYLLLHKVKCDTNIINQCLDRGCFILNDIDQCENIPHYAEKLIKNIKSQLNNPNNGSRNNYKFDKQFQEYKNKMEYIGLQENELSVDKSIDFHILYMYEQYKFQGFRSNNLLQNNVFQINDAQRKGDDNRSQINIPNNQFNNNQLQNQERIFILGNQYLQNLQNTQSIDYQVPQNKQPRRMRIFNNLQSDKENKGAVSISQFIQKNNENQNSEQNK